MAVAPADVRKIARKALDIRETLPKSRRAGTLVGLARANQLAKGEEVTLQTLLRMRSYLLRARANYRNAKSQGKTAENSKAIQAYMLWGSTPGLRWAQRQITKLTN